MSKRDPNRNRGLHGLCLTLTCLTLLGPGGSVWASSAARQELPTQAPAPIERRPPSPRAAQGTPVAREGMSAPRGVGSRALHGMHLSEWMNQHSSLTPDQQQRALQQEPGFGNLPQQTQQRMRNRLSQLDAMTPQQRSRLLARNEAMERLSPEQRSEVRGAMSQLGALPLDQRREVARTFRALRDLPPEQRTAALNTGRFGQQMNEGQRRTLYDLLRVEPMLPPPANGGAAQAH